MRETKKIFCAVSLPLSLIIIAYGLVAFGAFKMLAMDKKETIEWLDRQKSINEIQSKHEKFDRRRLEPFDLALNCFYAFSYGHNVEVPFEKKNFQIGIDLLKKTGISSKEVYLIADSFLRQAEKNARQRKQYAVASRLERLRRKE